MPALFSLTNLLLGNGIADRRRDGSARTETLETFAGTALVAGLALVGFGLRSIH